MNQQQISANEKRQNLIKILGEDSIGYWAIMDQILFYDDLINELNTQASTTASETH